MEHYKLVGLERRGKLSLGLILRTIKDKYEMYLETGEKVKIYPSKAIFISSITIHADDEKTMKLGIKEYHEKFSQEIIDLSIIWECFEEQSATFEELVSSYYGQYNNIEAGAVFVALASGNEYFQYHSGQFFKVSKEQLESTLQRKEIEQEKRKQEILIKEWLKNEGNVFCADSEQAQKIIEELKKFALLGETNNTLEGKRLATIFGVDEDQLLILLEKKGILPKNVNETITRYKLCYKKNSSLLEDAVEIEKSEEEYTYRKISDLWNIAIDSIDTREVDDAISYHREDNFEVVGVHIANVSHTIAKNSSLDKFARKQFATLYFPEEVYPLYPLSLVDKKLTLAISSYRPCISLFFYFDSDGDIQKYEFEQTCFSLGRRTSYEETHGQIRDEFEFSRLEHLASLTKQRRIEKGAVVTHIPDLKMKVNEQGEVSLKKVDSSPGQLIVSEFMILFNQYIAKKLIENNIPAFFRIQPKQVPVIKVPIEDPLYPIKIRVSMPGASLSLTPKPHNTLGVDCYTQGTSPIRRYSDLVVQRQLISLLNNENLCYGEKELLEIKADMEYTEKQVKKAEIERYRFWLFQYLKQNRNKIYKAYVSRVFDRNRIMVFLPEILQEFQYQGEGKNLTVGAELDVRFKKVSARKKITYLQLA